jgi:glycosyltransferase involved in cell wall biosynthesis
VTGTVPDVREYLGAAALSVVPLRIGGGSRLKILESMAASLPVVSTTIGAEGLDVSDGIHLQLADTPEAMAACIVDLLHRPEERRVLADAARELVTNRYDWDALAERNERVWRDAAARHSAASISVR